VLHIRRRAYHVTDSRMVPGRFLYEVHRLVIRRVNMRLRKAQIKALGTVRLRQWAATMTLSLEKRFPHVHSTLRLPTAELRELIYAICLEAGRYGLKTQSDLETYIDCVATVGSEFPKEPNDLSALNILERQDLTPTEKMDLIHDRLIFRQTS
jgi:hypothetical protein